MKAVRQAVTDQVGSIGPDFHLRSLVPVVRALSEVNGEAWSSAAEVNVSMENETLEPETGDEPEDDVMTLLEAKDWDGALKLVDERQKAAEAQCEMARFYLYVLRKDEASAMKSARKLGDQCEDNSWSLNELAWTIATADGLEHRDLALAEDLAAKANTLERGQWEAVLDTLARIKFMRGDKDGAIAIQQKAVAAATLSPDVGLKEQILRTLKSYQDGKLPAQNNPIYEDRNLEQRIADLLSGDAGGVDDDGSCERSEAAVDGGVAVGAAAGAGYSIGIGSCTMSNDCFTLHVKYPILQGLCAADTQDKVNELFKTEADDMIERSADCADDVKQLRKDGFRSLYEYCMDYETHLACSNLGHKLKDFSC